MYTIMLADDERNIREGIENAIEWGELGLSFIGSARDGREAYDKIRRSPPDILITDIKMPGLDGLELIERSLKEYPKMKVVLLSGYGEFHFASKAMQLGVRHYLLKPCDENEITTVLQEIVGELQEMEQKDHFIKNIKHQVDTMLPHVKEQFFRDLVLNRSYSRDEWDYYKKLLMLNVERMRLILFQPDGAFDYLESFALKNITEDIFDKPSVILSTIIGNQFLVLVRNRSDDDLVRLIGEVKETFSKYYKISLTVSYTESERVEQIPYLYKEALDCLKHSFYLGEGCIIAAKDVQASHGVVLRNMEFHNEKIESAVKIGNWADAEKEIVHFFETLTAAHVEIGNALSYCLELLVTISRQAHPDRISDYINRTALVFNMSRLDEILAHTLKVALEIAQNNYANNTKKYSMLVDKMIRLVHDNIANDELSLSWLAQNYLFMNVDYLGKLFKKETEENFSQYLMRVRIEKAKQMIESSDDYKIYEIAEQTGFGSNPQYFSQVFKKQLGFTPTDYKRKTEMTQE